MAIVTQKVVIEADQCKPVEEINNIISAFIGLWPGSEVEILTAVRAEIDRALDKFEEKKEVASAK